MSAPIVIVGGVAAGPKMAAKARREDPEVPIVLITDEPVISYAACGTPYFLGGVAPRRESMLVREADQFAADNRVEVLTRHRATAIDPAGHTVTVRNLETGESFTQPYAKLGLATGARPFVPPIRGLKAEGVFTLRSVVDAFAIDDYIRAHDVQRVVVAGAGFIGVEVVENFRRRGMAVTLVELAPQVLPPVDPVVAEAAAREIESHGVELLLGSRVEAVEADHRGRISRVVTDRGPIDTQMLILGVGVRPNAELAAEAGLTIGETGAIWVDPTMRTSDPDIYAAGDCAEQTHLVSGRPTWIPLGSTANKQGRTAAINLTGGHDTFPGVAGTALVQVFDLNIGRTGLQERDFARLGLAVETAIVPQGDRPGYMPGAAEIVLVLHAEQGTRRLLGAQAYGPGEVSKRIDVLAVALSAGMTVDQLASLDLGYAPPYAPALDVVITAANVLRNKLDQATPGIGPSALRECADGKCLVDCREPEEYAAGRLPGARLMPLRSIAERSGELDPEAEVVVYCKGGLRSAEAVRRLRHNGVKQAVYLDGGLTAWGGTVEG